MTGDMKILLPGVPGRTSRGYLGYCTVVLFRVEGSWALFDTGHYSDRHLLLEALHNVNVDPGEIDLVILSHLHFDHVLNLPLFKKAEVYLAGAEIEHGERVSAGKAVDPAVPDFWPALLEDRKVTAVGESLDLTRALRLETLPGHTPGTMAMFLSGTEGMAVCADVIKDAWEAVTGRSRMALAGEGAASESIKRVLERAGVVIPGHDRPFRRGDKSLEFLNPFKWEVQVSLFPDEAERTVLSLEAPGGPAVCPEGT